MTPHNRATKDQIAKVVIMPGDPLRAKYIAENFLDDYECVNDVRGMLAYTGYYKGKKITVMAHGMGIPSIGIYSYELFTFYDVDAIIRIGSCGAYLPEMELGDIIVAEKAVSLSTYAQSLGVPTDNHVLSATPALVSLVEKTAQQLNIAVTKGLVNSSDVFYTDDATYQAWVDRQIHEHGLLAAEMEGFGLYANAIKTHKQALTLLSVSDSVIDHSKQLTPEQRVTTFKNMMLLALESAIQLL